MEETCLIYRGKKTPFRFKNKTMDHAFAPGERTWIPADDAAWLTKTNPRMFHVVGNRGGDPFEAVEDASDMIAAVVDEPDPADALDDKPAETPDKNVFETPCGRSYRNAKAYRKHVEKCRICTAAIVEEAKNE